MSNSSYEEIAKARRNWKEEHLSAYLRSAGAEGHVMDLTDIGGHKFTTNLLLKYVGRKSGKTMVTPLIYGDIGGEVVIVASKGGADHHPAWYLNLKESKELSFQIGAQAYNALNHVNFGSPQSNASNLSSLGNIASDINAPTSPYGSSQESTVSGRVVVVQGRFLF